MHENMIWDSRHDVAKKEVAERCKGPTGLRDKPGVHSQVGFAFSDFEGFPNVQFTTSMENAPVVVPIATVPVNSDVNVECCCEFVLARANIPETLGESNCNVTPRRHEERTSWFLDPWIYM
jgi:hypothetical protein